MTATFAAMPYLGSDILSQVAGFCGTGARRFLRYLVVDDQGIGARERNEAPASTYTFRYSPSPVGDASRHRTATVAATRLRTMQASTDLQSPANDVECRAIGDDRTVQELAIVLRDMGLPISAIAEMSRVGRKTVYSWIDGEVTVPSMANLGRLRILCSLLSEVPPGSMKLFHRLWERPVAGSMTLREALVGHTMDPEAARVALTALRPAVDRLLAGQARKAGKPDQDGAAASLTEYIELVLP